jgi:nucleoside diphosphate kinase
MKDIKTFLQDNIKDPMSRNHVFVVIKPGFEHLAGLIEEEFKKNGYKTIKMRTKRLMTVEAEDMYIMHKNEDFYDALCKYMSSGITIAYILKKKSDDIFKEFAVLKDKLREKYGESDMRNVLHSSDSYKNMTHESQVYFNNINQEDLTK